MRTIGFTDDASSDDPLVCFDRKIVSSAIRHVLDNGVRYTNGSDQISVRLFRPSSEQLSQLGNLLAPGCHGVIDLSDRILLETRTMVRVLSKQGEVGMSQLRLSDTSESTSKLLCGPTSPDPDPPQCGCNRDCGRG